MCNLGTMTLIVDLIYGTVTPERHVNLSEYKWVYWEGISPGITPSFARGPHHILGENCFTDPDTINRLGLKVTPSARIWGAYQDGGKLDNPIYQSRPILGIIQFYGGSGSNPPRYETTKGAYWFAREIMKSASPDSWIKRILWTPPSGGGTLLYVNPGRQGDSLPDFITPEMIRTTITVNH